MDYDQIDGLFFEKKVVEKPPLLIEDVRILDGKKVTVQMEFPI